MSVGSIQYGYLFTIFVNRSHFNLLPMKQKNCFSQFTSLIEQTIVAHTFNFQEKYKYKRGGFAPHTTLNVFLLKYLAYALAVLATNIIFTLFGYRICNLIRPYEEFKH